MDVITYTDARNSFKDVLDRAINDRDPVIITRKKREAAVVMSLEDYNSIQETLHLLRSPNNARRLMESIARLEAGEGEEHALIQPEGEPA
ncbi:type II toxin-antitoxin system Phd/YefM family antitoxin [Paracoccus sp. MKU1]|uniref:type II toxin-antitoxin system Phd/YefM family antitoxin n=1 Tax=Paracoccus sp. MKU1 TaxID=1745182 RepID=UPI0007193553|nr:type II toxin-antitoxin system prevent-host-death family antitoxin [Paracoccus sp. MKU1]KRW94366.1 prevent-host-death protein [Paracoccus sp. MKU1]